MNFRNLSSSRGLSYSNRDQILVKKESMNDFIRELLHSEVLDDHFPSISHNLFSVDPVEDVNNSVKNLPMYQNHCTVEFPRTNLCSSRSEKSSDYRFRIFISCLLNINCFEVVNTKIFCIECFSKHITIVEEKISSVDINCFSNH